MSDVFERAINQVSHHIGSKQELIAWGKSQFGESTWTRAPRGQKSGSRQLAELIQPYMPPGKNGQPMSIANIQRNWQGNRANQTGDTKTWRQVGQKLPRIMDKKEFTLIIDCKQHDNRGGGKTRDRTIRVDFAGQAARDFVNYPTWPKVWHQYGFSFPVAGSDAEDWGEDDIDFDYNEYDVDIEYELSDASVSAA
jgi:hypothetical protein